MSNKIYINGRFLTQKLSGVQRHAFELSKHLSEIDKNKIDILQRVDNIYIEYLKKNFLYNKIWQAFAVLLPVKSVGVMGDERTYNYAVSLRAVTSVDGMTADFYMFKKSQLTNISKEIISKVKEVNRVLFDFTSKPPGTIEWE